MRRLLIAAASTLLAASVATAAPLTLGVRAGSSIPNLRDHGGNELSSGWSSRVAPYAAMFADWPIGGPFSLQAEIAYAPQGGKKNGLQPVTDPRITMLAGSTVYARFDDEARLDYIEVPLLLQYRLGGPHGHRLVAGPYVGFLVSAKQVTKGTSAIYADKAGTQPLPLPDVDLGSLKGYGADVPLLVGWESAGGLYTVYGGPRGGYEHASIETLTSEPRAVVLGGSALRLDVDRFHAGGVVGFATGFRHVHVALELGAAYQVASGSFAGTEATVRGLTLTPASAIWTTF